MVDLLSGLFTETEGIVRKSLPLFTAGTHTDSIGVTRTWTNTHLDHVVEAFKTKFFPVVPIKFGHTSDKFTDDFAEVIGVPGNILILQAM